MPRDSARTSERVLAEDDGGDDDDDDDGTRGTCRAAMTVSIIDIADSVTAQEHMEKRAGRERDRTYKRKDVGETKVGRSRDDRKEEVEEEEDAALLPPVPPALTITFGNLEESVANVGAPSFGRMPDSIVTTSSAERDGGSTADGRTTGMMYSISTAVRTIMPSVKLSSVGGSSDLV